jgi:hypothetical protein
MGSTTVLINNQMACRMLDFLQGASPPNFFTTGCMTVLIGDNGFGMAKRESMSSFATGMRQLLAQWGTLTHADRLSRIQSALNNVLAPSMPPVTVRENKTFSPYQLGQFDYSSWSVDISSNALGGNMDEDRMKQLVDTAYHEGRHAEQWWNVAQFSADKGQTALEIADGIGIPESVAYAATVHRAGTGTSEHVMGESVHASVYGDRGRYRNDVLSSISTSNPLIYDQYRALPEEQDAWHQGGWAAAFFELAR